MHGMAIPPEMGFSQLRCHWGKSKSSPEILVHYVVVELAPFTADMRPQFTLLLCQPWRLLPDSHYVTKVWLVGRSQVLPFVTGLRGLVDVNRKKRNFVCYVLMNDYNLLFITNFGTMCKGSYTIIAGKCTKKANTPCQYPFCLSALWHSALYLQIYADGGHTPDR